MQPYSFSIRYPKAKTVRPIAYKGTPKKIPNKPARLPATNKMIIIVNGWIDKDFPITFG